MKNLIEMFAEALVISPAAARSDGRLLLREFPGGDQVTVQDLSGAIYTILSEYPTKEKPGRCAGWGPGLEIIEGDFSYRTLCRILLAVTAGNMRPISAGVLQERLNMPEKGTP